MICGCPVGGCYIDVLGEGLISIVSKGFLHN